NTQIGPLVSQQQLERVTGYLALGKQEGARPVAGGERLTEGALASGYFIPPTVFTDVQDNMRIAQEEIFGPVIAAIPFTDIEEVARRANATPFGLGSGVWTRDVSKAHRLAKAIRAGSVLGKRLPGHGSGGAVGGVQEWLAKAIRAGSVVGKRLPGQGSGGAIGWVQDERLRPRVGTAAARGVPEREG